MISDFQDIGARNYVESLAYNTLLSLMFSVPSLVNQRVDRYTLLVYSITYLVLPLKHLILTGICCMYDLSFNLTQYICLVLKHTLMQSLGTYLLGDNYLSGYPKLRD